MALDQTVAASRDARRFKRETLRRGAARLSAAEWLRRCGRVSVRPHGAVAIRGGQAGAGYAGVETCGSWSSCPCCAGKIGAERASDLGAVIEWAARAGHTTVLSTFTARHHVNEHLAPVWDRVQGSWEGMTRGWASETPAAFERRHGAWRDRWDAWHEQQGRPLELGEKKLRRPRASIKGRRIGFAEAVGMIGWARAVETTYTANGWHTHLHVVMVFETARLAGPFVGSLEDRSEAARRSAAAIEDAMFDRWSDALEARGGSAIRRDAGGKSVGVDVRVLDQSHALQFVGDYLTKSTDALASAASSMAREVTLGHFKYGARGSVTPFELLAAAMATGAEEDVMLWRQWVHTARGRKQLTWSRSLREAAGLAALERTDEEIAGDEGPDEDLVVLPAPSWRRLRDDDQLRSDVLYQLDVGGYAGLVAFLDQHQLEWITPAEYAWRILEYAGDPASTKVDARSRVNQS